MLCAGQSICNFFGKKLLSSHFVHLWLIASKEDDGCYFFTSGSNFGLYSYYFPITSKQEKLRVGVWALKLKL